MRIIFYYDVVCPYAYLAAERIESLAERAGVDLQWQPILLGGVFRSLGTPDDPMDAMAEAKRAYSNLDLARLAAFYDLPLKLPPGHPRRTVDAMRLCLAVQGPTRVLLTH